MYELPHDFTLRAPTFLPSALPGAAMTSGNRLELLENGDAIFPAMLAAISSAAETTVNFEAYIFWSDEVGTRFRDALAERAAHGVEVRRPPRRRRLLGPAPEGRRSSTYCAAPAAASSSSTRRNPGCSGCSTRQGVAYHDARPAVDLSCR